MADKYTPYAGNGVSDSERGGFVALAVIAAAVGAGAALLWLLTPARRPASAWGGDFGAFEARRRKRLASSSGRSAGSDISPGGKTD